MTEEEHKSIQENLELTDEKMNLLVNASSYVFEQALYHSLNPEKLSEQLQVQGLGEPQALAFQYVWQQAGAGYVAKMKERSLGGPSLLRQVSWNLQLKVGQESSQREKQPIALFEFELGTEQQARENVTIEFTKNELFKFFTNLEQIQEQLDNIM